MELILSESIRVNQKDDDNHPPEPRQGLPTDEGGPGAPLRTIASLRRPLFPGNRGKALKAEPCAPLKGGNHDYDSLLDLFERVLSQERNSPGKIYSLHEPEVQCISKGKEHKKYEFGNKVSIIRSITGIILGASVQE